jgi:NhaA family Na+:H+ antiporter
LAELEASNLSAEMSSLNSEQMETFEQLHQVTSEVVPSGLAFEHYLHPVTSYVILPLFALFNAGIVIDYGIVKALTNTVGLGVLLGLLVGKQVGIMVACWIVVRLRLAEIPPGVTWGGIHGAAILAGIGFTMAIFIADLAIPDPQLLGFSKVGVLAASAVCGSLGYGLLRMTLPKTAKSPI